jgi:predicted nucleic acid-binding protein
MSRVYWDSMMFIYLSEGHPKFGPRVMSLLASHRQREDRLFTSHVTVGEVLAGVYKRQPEKAEETKQMFENEMILTLLPFDGACTETFARLRATTNVNSADAMHLATAAAVGMDLFLTGDRGLQKLRVPGIHFIADLNTEIL